MHIVLTAAALIPITLAVVLHFDQLAQNSTQVLRLFGIATIIPGGVITVIGLFAMLIEDGTSKQTQYRTIQTATIIGLLMTTAGTLSLTGTHYG